MPMEKTFDAATRETALYQAWEKAGCFAAGANAKPGASTYCIMLPPPNVTGVLHVGHAFSQTLMDILIRWKRMQGFDTLWQPGLDHAGIATQLMVEKDLAKRQMPKRTEMGREEFLGHVWEWKQTSGGIIEQQARRMGHSMDWERSAFTMSGAETAPEGEKPGNFHDAVIKVFVDMYNKGLIYRGKRLVNWDPHFETAISDLEVENKETPGHMWHFKYPLAGGATYEYVEKDEDGNVTLRETRDYISIATTRPETMLGDGAVAVNPKDERYAPIVGKLCEIPVGPKEHRRLIPIITDPYPDPDFGSGAVKITGAHDFNDYEVAKRGGIPMYSLMDTKGHMRSDGRPYAEEAAVAQRIAKGEEGFDEARIAAMNLVPDEYRGLDRFEARSLVIKHITEEGNAVMIPNPKYNEPIDKDGEVLDLRKTVPLVEAKPIMQPFGDRSKVVIEPMLTDQWFVDSAKIVEPALEAVRQGRTKIMPESGEKVYFHWLENIEPWCISRQLWWGHRIPVWYAFVPEDVELLRKRGKSFADHLERFDAGDETEWADLNKPSTTYKTVEICAASQEEAEQKIQEIVPFEVHCNFGEGLSVLKRERYDTFSGGGLPKTENEPIMILVQRDPDVLDTWFSSGLWPFGTLGWPEDTPELKKYFPTDVLVTGQDILFFWVARMMMMSQAVLEEDPFHTVYLHQLVRDAKGEKMSKTRGNVIDPLDMVDQYGADALRFSNAQMAALGGVLKISEDRIKGYRNFGTKLWNACRFAEMNGVFDADARMYSVCTPAAQPVHADRPVNQWIIGETARVREEVDAALESYRFNDAANALYAFVWGKVCDWYVELSKPLLMDGTPEEKLETQRVMRWTLEQCLILLHPIMPFITEELWAIMGNKDSFLMLQQWPGYTAEDMVNPEAEAELRWTIALIEGTRSARAQMNVPAGLQVPVIQLDSTPEADAALTNNEAMIKRLARIASITKGQAPKGALTVATPGATFALPLADIIDVAAEKARIQKNIDKLQKEIGGLSGRLNNPKFAASAPADVVAEATENLRLRTEEQDQLKAALARLNEID